MRPDERFKFVDDLTILEIVNLLTVGISSFNIKHQIPNDIKEGNQNLPAENLKSQQNLDIINAWTKEQKIMINQSKTKTMIIKFTNNYQFNTRLKINNEILETVEETKLLGTILSNDLTWAKTQIILLKSVMLDCRF